MRNWVWLRNEGREGRVRGLGAIDGVPVGAWLRCLWVAAGPGRASSRRVELPNSDPAPLVWRAPEGPEGTGGLRGAAPNEVRSPSLAGGRALRRLEHPWGHKKHQHSPLHSNTPKSHMRNMRAS